MNGTGQIMKERTISPFVSHHNIPTRSTPDHLTAAAAAITAAAAVVRNPKKGNITMAMISAFTTVDKTAHNSRKFAFTLSPTNYGYWKTMIEPFLIINSLMDYVDGSISCPSKTLSDTDGVSVPKETPNYPIWVSNDAHVRMLIISTISEASFRHVQGTTSRDLWLSLKKVYAPHSTSREYTLKAQLLRIKMHGDETHDAYLDRAQEYANALAAIDEPVKDKDLVMLVVSGLREEYNGLKTTITARQSPTAFNELHALLSDHDYMLGKTRRDNGRQFDWASTQNTVYGTCNRCGIGHIPSQCLNRDPSTIRTRPSANFANTRAQLSNASANWHSDTKANSHVTPNLEAMDNSEAYYGDDALHVGNAQKSDVYSTFKSFVQMVERQFTTKLKNVQTDWGGEFHNLASFFSSLGIIHRKSCPHTSEQNGFVERRNRHVVETGLNLLAQACVP
ncbi:integrase [Tanacetum coccineum]